MYKRVLLKLSGEALSNGINDPFCKEHLDSVALEIKQAVKEGVQVCVVVGGGNIYRGKMGETMGMDRATGDYMGMLATVMNSLALSHALSLANVDNEIMSSIEMKGIAKEFSVKDSLKALDANKVLIFACGTGHPYFSTDTTSALRALESKCEVILAAKNGVDGVYSDDPRTNPNAKKYNNITYDDIIIKGLKVMDTASCALCKQNSIPIVVFDFAAKGSINKILKGENIGTYVGG